MRLAKLAKNFIKHSVGTVARMPRIYNVDKDQYITGYAEVNQMATTAFSRIRVNKGFFFCQLDSTIVAEGDLILDRADNKNYLVMSLKAEILKEEAAYVDATLFYCDTTATIQRFVEGTKDMFGREVVNTPTDIATDVKIMTSSMNYDVLDKPDREIAQDKIKIYLQRKHGIQEADRVVTEDGEVYKVISVNRKDFVGIDVAYVDMDVR